MQILLMQFCLYEFLWFLWRGSPHLHLSVMQGVPQVVSVHRTHADVTHRRHHALHRNRSDSGVWGRPAEVSASSTRLKHRHLFNYSHCNLDQYWAEKYFQILYLLLTINHRALKKNKKKKNSFINVCKGS